MHDVALAFFWHQHQPYYPDDVSQDTPMPWVRLHGVKDYWGMAKLLEEVPELHATINLVPSLLVQLLGVYRVGPRGRAPAGLAAPGRRPGRSGRPLSPGQLLHGQSGSDDPAFRPLPRALPEAGIPRRFAASGPGGRFSKKDLLDLQCWSNLVWFHPLAFETRRRAGRVPQQGPSLHGEGEALAAGAADGVSPPGRAVAREAAGAGPDRADDDALLPSDPAACSGTSGWPAGRCPTSSCPSFLDGYPGGRRGAGASCRRATTSGCSARSRGACGPPKARSARA